MFVEIIQIVSLRENDVKVPSLSKKHLRPQKLISSLKEKNVRGGCVTAEKQYELNAV